MSDQITVCVCTYRRPAFLQRLLEKLNEQVTSEAFTFSIAVCDNDAAQSAAPIVSAFREKSALEISYACEPRQNIALARNKVLELAQGDFVAFIDDDEFPAADWLQQLHAASQRYDAAGILGPVRPHFEEPPPRWVLRGQFCERPEHPTGRVMRWDECRTGNVLFRRAIIAGAREPFASRFGTGGEDMDFFRRMDAEGRNFVWCAEAVAYEWVPANRLTRRYMLKRALLRGKNILKHSTGRQRLVAISVAACPIYLLVLPVMALAGHNYFMRYSIKLCDHAGRLLELFGINPVSARDA